MSSTSREIRKVPLGWLHPKDENGEYVPLMDRKYPYTENDTQELLEEGHSREEIEKWFMPDFSKVPSDQMGISAYETVSEGTPMSPVYPDTPEGRFELARYCVENQTVFGDQKADIETWAAILFGKYNALVTTDRRIILTPPPKSTGQNP